MAENPNLEEKSEILQVLWSRHSLEQMRFRSSEENKYKDLDTSFVKKERGIPYDKRRNETKERK